MKNRCENCGRCCVDTEMILSQQDIKLIKSSLSSKIRIQDFAFKNKDKQFQLKNIQGNCVFFDYTSKKCNIYKFRPQGCKFYPLTYDLNEKKCKLDEDCPRTNLFYKTNQDIKKDCQNLKIFLKKQLKMNLN